MDIGYQDVSENSVVIGIRTQWNTILTDVTINNDSYNQIETKEQPNYELKF